jgi:hypothetical protein
MILIAIKTKKAQFTIINSILCGNPIVIIPDQQKPTLIHLIEEELLAG